MGSKNILNYLIEELKGADLEARRMILEAKNKAKALLSKAREEAEEIKEEILEKAEKEAEGIIKRAKEEGEREAEEIIRKMRVDSSAQTMNFDEFMKILDRVMDKIVEELFHEE